MYRREWRIILVGFGILLSLWGILAFILLSQSAPQFIAALPTRAILPSGGASPPPTTFSVIAASATNPAQPMPFSPTSTPHTLGQQPVILAAPPTISAPTQNVVQVIQPANPAPLVPTLPSSPQLTVTPTMLPTALPDQSDGIPEGYMLIEGDILVPETFFDHSQQATYTTRLWPDGEIPYACGFGVDCGDDSEVRQAMDRWEAVANVHFIQFSGQTDYIMIRDSRVDEEPRNNSPVGWERRGQQTVNVFQWDHPQIQKILLHELGHTLGFWHEHNRPDRDSYVRIIKGNIAEYNSNDWGISGAGYGDYDYDSIMHYDQYAGSVCRVENGPTCTEQYRTIEVLQNPAKQNTIGTATDLSPLDAEGMRFLYPFPDPNPYTCSGVPGGDPIYSVECIGKAGAHGLDGPSGRDGADGANGSDGLREGGHAWAGTSGDPGDPGLDGKPGENGPNWPVTITTPTSADIFIYSIGGPGGDGGHGGAGGRCGHGGRGGMGGSLDPFNPVAGIGGDGGYSGNAGSGGYGGMGGDGGSGGNVSVEINAEIGNLSVLSQAGFGEIYGHGGGLGGDGGHANRDGGGNCDGGSGGTGLWPGLGGVDGIGGDGGNGANGGNGGKGGNGGNGGDITINVNARTGSIEAESWPSYGHIGGMYGAGSDGGRGGSGRTPGKPGTSGRDGSNGESGTLGRGGNITITVNSPVNDIYAISYNGNLKITLKDGAVGADFDVRISAINYMPTNFPDSHRALEFDMSTTSAEECENARQILVPGNADIGELVINGQLFRWEHFDELVNKIRCEEPPSDDPGYGSDPSSGSTITLDPTWKATSGITAPLRISETGNAPLTVNSATFSGTDAAKFSFTQPFTAFTIPDGGSAVTRTLRCNTSEPGDFTATLTVNHNAPDSPATYLLECHVAAPGYASNPAPDSTLTINTFTGASTGNSAALEISETGDLPLLVRNATIGGANASKFRLDTSLRNVSIPDGGAAVIRQVVCNTNAAGTFTARLTVTHNAPDSPAIYYLSCVVTAAPGIGSTPVLGTPLVINTIRLATTGNTARLQLRETGVQDLIITNISLSGIDASRFQITAPPLPITIRNGRSAVTITLHCDTSTGGTFNAALTIEHNAPSSPTIFPVVCNVAVPGYGSTPAPNSTITFSPTWKATSGNTAPLRISETGDVALTVSGATISGVNVDKFSFTRRFTGFTINNGRSAVMRTLKCNTSEPGTFTATLTVNHNGAEGFATYPLECHVRAPGYASNPTSGSTLEISASVGDSVGNRSPIEISETGDLPLVVRSATISGTNTARFRLDTSLTNVTMPNGGPAITRQVICSTNTVGTFTARLTVTHNAPGSPAVYNLICIVTPISLADEPTGTPEFTPTSTEAPTLQPEATSEATDMPTEVPTSTATFTVIPSETLVPTATETPSPIPTETSTLIPTNTEAPIEATTEADPP